jgi:hypothetical protein
MSLQISKTFGKKRGNRVFFNKSNFNSPINIHRVLSSNCTANEINGRLELCISCSQTEGGGSLA